MPDVLARSLASLTRCLAVKHETAAALLARYTSANDPAAFAELVRRHGPIVYGAAIKPARGGRKKAAFFRSFG
jgi:hypothetical protein